MTTLMASNKVVTGSRSCAQDVLNGWREFFLELTIKPYIYNRIKLCQSVSCSVQNQYRTYNFLCLHTFESTRKTFLRHSSIGAFVYKLIKNQHDLAVALILKLYTPHWHFESLSQLPVLKSQEQWVLQYQFQPAVKCTVRCVPDNAF